MTPRSSFQVHGGASGTLRARGMIPTSGFGSPFADARSRQWFSGAIVVVRR